MISKELISYDLIKPSFLKPYIPYDYEKINLRKLIRYFLQSTKKSFVIKMFVENKEAGFCFLESGGFRYPWAKANDWVVSPYFIKEDYRGNRLGSELLTKARSIVSESFNGQLYAEVRKNNLASVKTLKALNADVICEANNHIKYKIVEDGDYLVFKII